MNEFCSRAMPYIKAAVTDESEPAIELSHEDSPVILNLGNGLLVLYVVDTGTSFEYVQQRHLSKAAINQTELHAIAIENLLRFMANKTRVQPHGNIFALFLDGDFEASLLLIDQLWDASLAEYAPSGFVVAVPARDVLAFADANSSLGIAELRGVIGRAFPIGDHLISATLFRREVGKWVLAGIDTP